MISRILTEMRGMESEFRIEETAHKVTEEEVVGHIHDILNGPIWPRYRMGARWHITFKTIR